MSDPVHPSLRTVTNTTLLEGLHSPTNDVVWGEFVNRYRPMIVRYAGRMGLNDEDAQDASQQALIAFCTAYRQGQYQREKGRLRFWLFGIARRQISNFRRQQADREVQVVDDTSQTGFFGRIDEEDPSEKVWDEEWRDAVLRQCLEEVRREFDAKTTEAFELFAWKGWPAAKVAEHLGMTSNAVFIAKHRVVKRIQELLPQMEEIW